MDMDIICRVGCNKIFKTNITRNNHERHHCKILKIQKKNNIELEQMKNDELEKLKIEIKLLKKNLKKETKINEENKNEIKLLKKNVKEYIEYKGKYAAGIEEIEILKNKNAKLKLEIEKLKLEIEKITLEKNEITTDYLNLSKLTNQTNLKFAENATDMNMKFVQNTTDINMKLVQNSADINVNALKFLTKRITDVPVLKQKNKEIVKSLENSKTNNLPLPNYIVMKYKKNVFPIWLGEIIAKAYKGNTNELQEIFTTDTSRLKYIIGRISDVTKKAQWVEDVGGLQVMELAIKPILEMISKIILDAIKQKAIEDSRNIDKMDKYDIDKMMEFQTLGTKLIDDITKNKLPSAILKNIASHLTFKRSNFDSDKKLLEDKKPELNDLSEDEKPKNKKIIKKEIYDSSDYESSTDEDDKPKKIIKKKVYKSSDKKIIKKEVYESSDYESSTDEDEKPKKIIKKSEDKKIIKKVYEESESSESESSESESSESESSESESSDSEDKKLKMKNRKK
jgi:hypothetical protein